MEPRRQALILGLLTAAAVLMALLVVGYHREDAMAQDAAAPRSGPPPLIAVTGACGLGAEVAVLYVIDTEKKALCVYSAFGGRELSFEAMRKIYYDFELIEANDATNKVYSARNLKQRFEEAQKKKAGEQDSGPRRR